MKSFGILGYGGFKFSERGMISERYIRIKVISFRTPFLLITHIISYREIYNKSMLSITKIGSCPEIYIAADRHVKDVNAFPFIPLHQRQTLIINSVYMV